MRGHPSLLQALKKIKKYGDYLEKHSPVTKNFGLFFFDSLGLSRPEVIRHRKRLFERCSPPHGAEILILLPQTQVKPFYLSRRHQKLTDELRKIEGKINKIKICKYVAPFGIIPIELDEIYPLSQYKITTPFDSETINYVAKQIIDYIESTDYKIVILLKNIEIWKGRIFTACKKSCKKKGIPLIVINAETSSLEDILFNLKVVLKEMADCTCT